MKKYNDSNQYHIKQNASNWKGKFGIVFLGLGILVMTTVGYMYYNSRSIGSRNTDLQTGFNEGGYEDIIQEISNQQIETEKADINTTIVSDNSQNIETIESSDSKIGIPQKNISTISTTNNPQNTTIVQKSSDSKFETITMNYNESGLTPSIINLTVGKKYKIIINANTTIYGCMNAITLPGLDDNLQPIQEGEKIVFNVDATQPGEYEFVCGMGVPHDAKVVVK